MIKFIHRKSMKVFLRLTNRFLLIVLLVGLLSIHLVAQEYQLVWSDEFEGTELDLTKWEPMIGNGCAQGICGWGNNELEYYRAENAIVENGFLKIVAKKEKYENNEYTSARIRTKDKGDWKYGKFEMRAKLPIGQGLWPAFWMLPTDNVYGGWAASGEIDIMEYLGHEPGKVHGTIHYGGSWPNNKHSGKSFTLDSSNFHEDFHTFTLIWEEGKLQWLVDGELYQTKTSWYSDGGEFPAPFDQRFHLLLNLAVGGNWPGYPDESTEFPQEYVIDYVRVYQSTVTDVRETEEQIPQSFVLYQNYPNPFNSQTTIKYEIAEQNYVKLTVNDMLGRTIYVLVDENKEAGQHSVSIDAAELSSGTYLYTLNVGGNSTSRKLILMK